MSDKPSYNVILKGFDTMDQANSWLDWYSGQGEQDDCMGEWIGGGVAAVYTSGNTKITGNSIEQGVVVHYRNNNER